MADCNQQFHDYNSVIKLNDAKRDLLMSVRNNLRGRMERNFNNLNPEVKDSHKLEFQSQGSFVMDTIITPSDDDFDLDDGVYFVSTPNNKTNPENYHKWVLTAVGEEEFYGEVKDKDTCVRVEYKEGDHGEPFHIDLPIYYADNFENPDLAHKKKGWILSNPVKFIAWFEELTESGFQENFLYERVEMYDQFQQWSSDIRKQDCQLRRLVRYLKGWCDHVGSKKMPPGIILTILAGENYVPDPSDDVSMQKTLIKIGEYLKDNGFKCPRPTTPKGEDLFDQYDPERKEFFAKELSTFTSSANQAIASDNPKDACLKWQKHLGPRFSCAFVEDEMEKAATYPNSGLVYDDGKSA